MRLSEPVDELIEAREGRDRDDSAHIEAYASIDRYINGQPPTGKLLTHSFPPT